MSLMPVRRYEVVTNQAVGNWHVALSAREFNPTAWLRSLPRRLALVSLTFFDERSKRPTSLTGGGECILAGCFLYERNNSKRRNVICSEGIRLSEQGRNQHLNRRL
jgi:hypothetical protein